MIRSTNGLIHNQSLKFKFLFHKFEMAISLDIIADPEFDYVPPSYPIKSLLGNGLPHESNTSSWQRKFENRKPNRMRKLSAKSAPKGSYAQIQPDEEQTQPERTSCSSQLDIDILLNLRRAELEFVSCESVFVLKRKSKQLIERLTMYIIWKLRYETKRHMGYGQECSGGHGWWATKLITRQINGILQLIH